MLLNAAGNLGIGTTTPFSLLQLATTTGKNLVLTDSSAGANQKHWLFSSQGGNFYLGTSTDALSATTTYFSILNGGNAGFGATATDTKFVISANAGNGSGTFGGGTRLLDLQGSQSNFSEPKLVFSEQGNAIASISAKNSQGYTGALIFSTNGTQLAHTGDAERMRID